MNIKHYEVIIVGAGHAGAHLAATLRQRGYTGSVVMISSEPHLPYERPSLSKEYLSGTKARERMYFRPRAYWDEREVNLILGRVVAEVHPEQHRVTLADGAELSYDHLVWAAGGRPRNLPGEKIEGVHYLRSLDDADSLKRAVETVQHVVVIGGGYIGLESAATLSKAGIKITVLEAQERLLARVAGSLVGRFFLEKHRSHGIDVRLATRLERLTSSEGRLTGVELANGQHIACDLALVGVGIEPSIEPLIGAGAAIYNGVMVDDFCRTTLSGIYAIGDCATHPNIYAPGKTPIRLESVQNANDQALIVASGIMGEPVTYSSVPWFWSVQYDVRLQTAGLSMGFDCEVLRGDPESNSFSVIYLREGRVIALDCINSAKDFMTGKRLVEQGVVVSISCLQDTSRELSSLIMSSVRT